MGYFERLASGTPGGGSCCVWWNPQAAQADGAITVVWRFVSATSFCERWV
jgi:hypothetical protein